MRLEQFIGVKRGGRSRLARELGCSKPMVTYMCTGRKRPGPELMARIKEWSGGLVTENDWEHIPTGKGNGWGGKRVSGKIKRSDAKERA